MITSLLFALLPFITGFVVYYAAGKYAKKNQDNSGISASIVSPISFLFALFASLIFTEVWTKINKINGLLVDQASSLRSLKRLTEPLGENSIYFSTAVKNYIDKVKEQEITDLKLRASGNDGYRKKTFSNSSHFELYSLAMDSAKFKGNTAIQTSFFISLEAVRNTWFQRKELRKTRILTEKIYVLFIFGVLAQIAIAFSHLHDRKANKIAIILFTATFATAMFVLYVTESPYLDSHFIGVKALDDVL